jgi:hypothetical protein
MQRLEVSCAVRPLWWPLGVKGLIKLMPSSTYQQNTKEKNHYFNYILDNILHIILDNM